MKINQMVQESRLVEKEIELPYFCKVDDGYFIKAITEEKVLVVKIHNLWSQILFYELMSGHHSDIAKGKQITEQEFNEAYHKALFEISKYIPAPDAPKEIQDALDIEAIIDSEESSFKDYLRDNYTMSPNYKGYFLSKKCDYPLLTIEQIKESYIKSLEEENINTESVNQ